MTTYARPWVLLIGLALLAACGEDDANNNTPTPDMAVDMTVEPDVAPDLPVVPDMEPDIAPDLPPPDMELPGEEITPNGFTILPPVPSSCDMPSERYRLPFIISTDRFRPARIGDKVAGRALLPNETVTLGSVVTRRTRVAMTSPLGCTMDAECEDGFICASSGVAGAARQCTRSTGINFIPDTTRVDYDPGRGPQAKKQLVTLMIDNSASLLGFVPKEVGELYGEDGEKDLLKQVTRATDPRLLHRAAMKDFGTYLAGAVEADRSYYSIWRFGGSIPQDAVPLNATAGLKDTFTQDLTAPGEKIVMLPEPAGRLGGSNIYQGIQRVVEQDLGLDKYKDFEKFLFVFVDGPNEIWDSAATQQSVITALNAHNIHLFIMHYDPQIETSTLRDSWSYWAGNAACRMDASCQKAPTCAAAKDCQNFEQCRPAKIYPSDAAGTVTETPQKYCMPEYQDGRIGPIQAYSDLACRTGGNYLYVTDMNRLSTLVKVLPYVIDGQWSVEAELSTLDLAQGAKKGFYYLSGVFLGLFGNSSIGDTLSSPVPDLVDPLLSSVDTRPVVRVGVLNGED